MLDNGKIKKNMMKLKKITAFLNKLLPKVKDNSVNGLQVKGNEQVGKIAFTVDACLDVFEKAKKEKADLIIVHHGLFWKGIKKDEMTMKRVSFLKKNRISLYASHLPLDLHSKYGNNIQICMALELKNLKTFGKYRKIRIGFRGELKKAISLGKFVKSVQEKIKCKNPVVLGFGNKKLKSVAVVSGGASDMISEAIKEKIDVYLSGESPKHHIFHVAKEAKINAVFAGHYNTEVFGVKALSKFFREKFDVETVFIDSPTSL